MAYPPTPTLALAACPVIKAYTGHYDPTTGGPLTSQAFVQGGTLASDDLNQIGARSDLGARYGGGAWGVIPGDDGLGLNLSAGAGLTLNIAEGTAMMDGEVKIPAGTSVVLTDNIARVRLFLSQAGAIAQTNDSLTPPAGAQVFLGSATTLAGAITGVDFSGVLYSNGPAFHRYTLDSGLPADTPPSNLTFFQHQEGDGSLWIFDGAVYWPISIGGAGGPVAVADGGTGATTAPEALVNLGAAPLSTFTLNPVNGTNTISAADSQASVIIITGGTASSQFTVEFTTAGSPVVRAGHPWEIINKTSFGCIIRRSGSGLANVFLGQGSANDQRGRFVFETNEVRRVARDTAYISRVITATLTATQGQVEADFLLTGAQTGPQTLALPAVAGLEGQVVAHQADTANYPLTVKANGETEPAASMTLLPGEVQQVVQTAAGKYWPIGRQEREVIVDFTLDANRTLGFSDVLATVIRMQDTTVVLTVGRDVIWDTASLAPKRWHVVNETAQALVFKETGGTGVTVAAGRAADIRLDASLIMRRMSADVVF